MISHTLISLKDHFDLLKDQFEIVLFGSRATDNYALNSDYDIAIITRLTDKPNNLQHQWDVLKFSQRNLDIRIFELFPLTIQISIIKNYKVILGDPLEISEYFYYFRKKWNDCKQRILSNQYSHYKERLKFINYQKSVK